LWGGCRRDGPTDAHNDVAEVENSLARLDAKSLNEVEAMAYWPALLKVQVGRMHLLQDQRDKGRTIVNEAMAEMKLAGAKEWEIDWLNEILDL
jgi:hypothetical protein